MGGLAGSTGLSGPPRLVVTQGPLRGRVIEVDREDLVIGRHRDNDVVLDTPFVSGRHARITRDATGTRLTDLRTLGGTTVNGTRTRGATALRHGDEVCFGGLTLVYHAAGDF